jgi:quercetin dioxygenase-like cupin family protein
MRMQWSVGVGMGLCGLALGFGLGVVVGHARPPTEYQGVAAQVVSTIDLGPDLPGYQLRLRKVTVAPGGIVALHSHRERPGFAYILAGTVTELRDGGYVKEYGPGGVLTESRDVTHWAENRGMTTVVAVDVDLGRP